MDETKWDDPRRTWHEFARDLVALESRLKQGLEKLEQALNVKSDRGGAEMREYPVPSIDDFGLFGDILSALRAIREPVLVVTGHECRNTVADSESDSGEQGNEDDSY